MITGTGKDQHICLPPCPLPNCEQKQTRARRAPVWEPPADWCRHGMPRVKCVWCDFLVVYYGNDNPFEGKTP